MTEKEIRVCAINDFCNFVENFDGELTIKENTIFHCGKIVYIFKL